VHNVHATRFSFVRWTKCTLWGHNVHVTGENAVKCAKCTLIAADLLTSLPSRS
jgi:hypothetical protein